MLDSSNMKFSHSLQFNAVPEWSSKYIAYSHLKKLIYALQKDKLYASTSPVPIDQEARPLLSRELSHDVYVNRFLSALEVELKKIDKFFKSQETGLIANYNELKDDCDEFEQDLLHNRVGSISDAVPPQIRKRPSRRFSNSSMGHEDDDDEDDDEEEDDIRRRSTARSVSSAPDDVDLEIYHARSRTTNNSHFLSPTLERKITLKKRLVAIYTQLSELKSYIELNRTGFSKICKKFDKSLNTDIKSEYLKFIEENSHVFQPTTIQHIQACITTTTITYARLSQESFPFPLAHDQEALLDVEIAERELSSHLRDHVVWERNTVWKDMINLERKAQNVKAESQNLSKISKQYQVKEIYQNGKVTLKSEPSAKLAPRTLKDLIQSNPWQLVKLVIGSNWCLKICAIVAVFMTLLSFSPFDDVLQKNCFAILVFASLLWATEAIPLFVTSLLIPLLIVVLPVLRDGDGGVMEPVKSSQFILSTMWSSVIMLLLGGFTLAAALSKYNVAKVLSTYILSSAGTNPKIILLTNMGVALFASMWVSNVAAPVLCYSIIQPLLRTLPRHSTYAKSLILGIALASNIGGMASPIASPQNIFSIGLMDPQPSWGEWFLIAIPICVVCVMGIWILLIITFPLEPSLKLLQLHPLRDPFTLQQWFVTLVSIGTIVLWCLSNRLSGIFGEMGIISIIPLVTFFGTGLLTSEDFNNFMWTIVILAMGGTTLGKAVTSSGLLNTMASVIKENIEDKPVFVIVLIFGIVILTMATFVSHTVAAMIIVPLMSEIGANLPSGDHSRLLIMIAALLCSGAMGLPTSGFPNVTAISMIDEVGDRYLTVGTFITRGVPSSLITYAVIVTMGYGLMKTVGY